MVLSTGLAMDKRCREHVLQFGHPESPDRLARIESVFKQTGLDKKTVAIVPLKDSGQYMQLVHSDDHIASVLELPVTGDIAALAVSYGLGAVRSVCSGELKNAFCALRPPGHHAHNNGGNYDGRGQGQGFCFLNNIAIAARYAQKAFGLERILIADWDYHHGNGTEWAFYDDPGVLFFSTHCWMAYPGTGDPKRKGTGNGAGYNINVPLEHGAGDDDVLEAFRNILVPAAEKYRPELILVSAGFDSRENDLLGTFRFTDRGYAELTGLLMELADTYAGGRLVSFLEGGYDLEGNARAAAAHLARLATPIPQS